MMCRALHAGTMVLTLAVATAAAQDGEPLPLLTPGTVDVIQPEAPSPAQAAPAPATEPPPPSPEETLDEAAEALVQLLTTDTQEGPPMAQCAIDLLRSQLATAVDGDDVLTAIALEDELLALCNRRQQLVLEVLSTELLLAAMAAGDKLRPATHQVVVIEPTQPPPALAATLDQITAETAPAAPAPEQAEEAPPPPPASPGLSWVTVLGSAGNLRAAVTDGASMWWVRVDTTLPGNWRVTRIDAAPPGVTLYHAQAGHHALPFHAGPPPGSAGP